MVPIQQSFPPLSVVRAQLTPRLRSLGMTLGSARDSPSAQLFWVTHCCVQLALRRTLMECRIPFLPSGLVIIIPPEGGKNCDP